MVAVLGVPAASPIRVGDDHTPLPRAGWRRPLKQGTPRARTRTPLLAVSGPFPPAFGSLVASQGTSRVARCRLIRSGKSFGVSCRLQGGAEKRVSLPGVSGAPATAARRASRHDT